MDIPTFRAFESDFEEFAAWLTQKYPEDEELSTKLRLFHEKYPNLPMNVRLEKELKRKNSKGSLEEEIMKKLQQAYSADRRITGDYELKMTSKEECVQSYKDLQKLIDSDKRNVLYNSAKQGQVLKHLKANLDKGSSFLKCIDEKGISISLSHCNFLISLYELSVKHPRILGCSVELRFVKANMKIIRNLLEKNAQGFFQ